ncbi:MAG TPA: sensor histidine kinase [Lachnospiraceae bacterium]|jgi:two-component system sensor histidine kinase YesM|nr:sensor histidine kinase [Lachnospiraceae bacterium]HCR84460.1 sensor histidine kinase [Lachnospiraceae bacterium]
MNSLLWMIPLGAILLGGAWYVSRREPPKLVVAAVLFVLIIITVFINWITYRLIISPYKQHMEKVENYISNRKYEDLIDDKVYFFRGEREVWQQLDNMLDKQNLIRLSTKHAELLALQNQINPHFLYNTLEAIRGDALCEGMIEIADMTEALSTFFRYTISDTGNLVTLEDELENVENYFKIQKYRFGERLSLQVEFPEDYPKVLQYRLPKLTLQPIVENAVFHGLETENTKGLVLISIDSTINKLMLNIQDDGCGIKEERLIKLNEKLAHPEVRQIEKKKGGIALTNVSRRIKLLFGDEYGVHVCSILGMGTNVQVSVPIINEREVL